MTLDWQLGLALAAVALAAAEVLRRVAGTLRRPASGCGAGCRSCAKAQPEITVLELRTPQGGAER
jgi:hypothetical protein